MTAQQTKDAARALAASRAQQARIKRENAAHTPGPWFSDDLHSSDVYRYVLAQAGGHPHRVARLTFDGTQNDAIVEANARLIAAAPMLLDALDGLMCAVRMSLPKLDDGSIKWAAIMEAMNFAHQVASTTAGDTP